MTNYFTAADVTQLNEYALFARKLTASLTQFKKTINLRFFLNWSQSEKFETNKLINQATLQADIWLVAPRALKRLHSDFQQFTEEFGRQSEQLMNAEGSPDSSRLIELATVSTNKWLRVFNHQQESMIRLTMGIHTVLPRLIDYMHSNLYIFAGWQNKRSGINTGHNNIYMNALLAIYIPPDNNGARLVEGLNHVDNYQRTYALSYAAASNLIGHFTQLKELTAICSQHALALRGIKNSRHFKSRIKILLILLKEIRRRSATASALFQAPR
ncbi:MAG: hypothetical protein JWQ69_2391 [Pseudomonas sp.]|nr:hypothetical protein [Pseudomonas sp.]